MTLVRNFDSLKRLVGHAGREAWQKMCGWLALLDRAGDLISQAGDGAWLAESPEWVAAVAKWREDFMAACTANMTHETEAAPGRR